jgi:microcystin-dependent protein
MFAGSFAPSGWAICNGALQSIAENPTLYQLIGTTYGGDGNINFALPNLLGRVPVHQNNSTYVLGMAGGAPNVTLTTPQMPAHSHALVASNTVSNQTNPAGNVLSQSTQAKLYYDSNPNPATTMLPSVIGVAGGSVPHSNMQPFVAINFIIALTGIFPHT